MPIFKNHGVLGINARNLLYMGPYNARKHVKMADSKLKTKSFLSARGIPVPRLYGTIRSTEDLEKYDFSSLPSNFVVKPNRGFGGEGILPVWDRKDGNYILAGGNAMTQDEMEEHIADVLEGRFSISGVQDIGFFEQLLICDERLKKFSYKGLPDIRVVLYKLIPIMAMLRLPTRASKGKGNLHQGAVGVGIDIAKGVATHIVQGNQIIDEVPEAGEIRGFKIPYWDEILLIASKVQLATNLGYMAADISIDQNTGPVLLEINARAGLGVQVANLAPLRQRLERVEGIKVTTPEKAVRVAKDMFGHVIEKEIKHFTGIEVVGTYESAKILMDAKPYRVNVRINPNIERSQIDENFAHKIGLLTKKAKKLEDSYKIKFILSGKRVQTAARIVDLSTKDYDMVIGRRDLTGFLLDPSKKKSDEAGLQALENVKIEERDHRPVVAPKKNYRVMDDTICEVDKQIKLLHHLRPINLTSEREKFLKDEVKNPQFTYPDLRFDPYGLREKLEALELDETPLGRLFGRKRDEILQKIDLLEHRGTEHFMNKSVILFGEATDQLVEEAEEYFAAKPSKLVSGKEDITTDQAVKRFEKFFKKNGLTDWKVKIKEEMVSDCLAGKKSAFFIRKGACFSETRMEMLIAHEIETHIYTAENGKAQPYQIFQRGTGGYLTTQEGLAIYNQERAIDTMTDKHFWNAALVILTAVAQKKSFRDVYDKAREMGYDKERSFRFAMKLKRGIEDTKNPGAFTKDLLYFRGKKMVEEFVENGGDLRRLYIGKIDLPSLVEIEELPFLQEPKFVPGWV
jgi:alpha-L-glutamate ligase-like protein/uncharacterized protein (TIGR02421 family)